MTIKRVETNQIIMMYKQIIDLYPEIKKEVLNLVKRGKNPYSIHKTQYLLNYNNLFKATGQSFTPHGLLILQFT